MLILLIHYAVNVCVFWVCCIYMCVCVMCTCVYCMYMCVFLYQCCIFISLIFSPDLDAGIQFVVKVTTCSFIICDWLLENRPNCHTGPIPFIGPANGYTHTLHIHSAIIRLDWLVCFSRATFADPVNSWLRQWDSWKAPNGRHGFEIHHTLEEKMYLSLPCNCCACVVNDMWSCATHMWY